MTPALSRIALSEPSLGGNLRAYIEECIATNFVSSVGPFVERFEQEFARFVGSRYAVACASGTAALHVGMRLLGVQMGDEVLVSTMTFIASANPILYERASPVLVDAEMTTWNLDPVLIVEELERRHRARIKMPRAVEIVHILGHPAEFEIVQLACERFGVAVIEDAAEALGACYTRGRFAGKQVGTIGQVGCFSFNGNKILTTGGGGMITTDDEALARRAKHLTTQARLPGAEYRHDDLGYNYRLTNMAAAMGVAQLEQLPWFLARKQAIATRYNQALVSVEGVSLPPQTDWAQSSNWLYTIGIDPLRFGADRMQVMAHLETLQIQARPIWTPLHLMPLYQGVPRLGGHVAEHIHQTGLSLPCSVGLTEADQLRVIEGIRDMRRAR